MLEQIRNLKEMADKLGKVAVLLEKAKTIDADKDGKADIAEFTTLGLRALGEFGELQADAQKLQATLAEIAILAGEDFQHIAKELDIKVPQIPGGKL